MPTIDAAAGAALIDELTKIVAQAAAAILARSTGTGMRIKADGSPVTDADEAAEAIICESLARIAPGVPVISEEQSAREAPPATERSSYFLVDPLDGTREFIAGRNEYTINIALVANGVPVLGIICAPTLGDCWRGVVGKGADRILKTAEQPADPDPHPAATAGRNRRRGQPLASGRRNPSLCRWHTARQDVEKRLVDKVLPDRRRQLPTFIRGSRRRTTGISRPDMRSCKRPAAA